MFGLGMAYNRQQEKIRREWRKVFDKFKVDTLADIRRLRVAAKEKGAKIGYEKGYDVGYAYGKADGVALGRRQMRDEIREAFNVN